MEDVLQYFDFSGVDCGVNHGDMIKYTIYIDFHFFLGEVLDKLHVAIADGIHEGVPVVGSEKLIDEMREGVEEVDDLFGLSFFLVN